MSYDLMVFDKHAAPRTSADFMKWYEQLTEWAEEHTYDDPAVSTNELRAWYLDMVKIFPDLNGPDAAEEESDRLTDYSIGMSAIYAAFAWSMAGPAYEATVALAEKHQVGFFDVSSDNGQILVPVDGKLQSLERSPTKRWWKFW